MRIVKFCILLKEMQLCYDTVNAAAVLGKEKVVML